MCPTASSGGPALEKLKHEKSATLLRSQQAETKANAAEAKKEALRMATEEMIALLAQVNPDITPSPQGTRVQMH